MIVNVFLNTNLKLENLNYLLSKYRDYKSIERELKINSLLGNKCQLEINSMDPPIYSGFDVEIMMSVKKVAFVITEILITIDKDLNILEILLDIKVLNTDEGKILNNLFEKIIFEPVMLKGQEYLKVFNFKATLNKIAA